MSARIYFNNAEYIAVNPAGLNAQTDDHLVNPDDQVIRLQNFNEDVIPIQFTVVAVSVGNWLSVSPSGGTIGNDSPFTITASFDSSLLDAGTYEGTITVTTAGGDIDIPVVLVVEGG